MENKMNELKNIFNIIKPFVKDKYVKQVWFFGKSSNGWESADFWYINSNNELVIFSQDIEDDKAFDDMIFEVENLKKVLKADADITFRYMVVKYEFMNGEKIEEIELDDIDWVDEGYDSLDILNYYLTKTVGESYVLGYPEEKDVYLDIVHKMQEHNQ
ncbi:hypothetical protein JOC36_000154 [Weissella uvarum]|uniref:hypothetical protein n=1 Tax=Weissella uvarum TaxID=1479233 RepID=UPI00195FE224|nr:hypothetical protein [Weissella uvarum]MBM7616621.1 hypothetical protein [Weissella uvarum]MCM0594921.1 hypothetical protein [Weissella uvarum]